MKKIFFKIGLFQDQQNI